MDAQTLTALQTRDYTLILDKSGSMGAHFDTPNKASRWNYLKETTIAVAQKFHEVDTDGMTLILFSSNVLRKDSVKPDEVAAIFDGTEPTGGTDLARAINEAANNYFDRRTKGQAKSGGEYFMVMTDGEPDNQNAVAKAIVAISKKLNSANEMNFTFVQVGQDEKAKKYLQRLDDQLEKEGAKYDIVDTLTIEAIGSKNLTDVIMDAVTEHKQH